MQKPRSIFGIGLLVVAIALPAWADPRSDYLEGVKRYNNGDMMESMTLLKRGADAGDADAQAFYAFVLSASELEEEAVAYYQKSAAQGNLEGIYGLAGKFSQGEGVKKDQAQAWKLYHSAAAKGHQGSIIVIASAYMLGGYGLTEEERNSPNAVEWMRKAGEMAFLPAVEALIRVYRDGGLGIQPDPAQVNYWAAKAAAITGVKDDGSKKRKRK